MRVIEPLLINLLVLIILLLFVPLLAETYKQGLREKTRQKLIVVCSFLAILFCILSPLRIGENYLVDLRWVAFLIGCMYSNLVGVFFLLGSMHILRFFIGGADIGALATFYSSIPIIILIFITYKFSYFQHRKKRYFILFGLTLSHSLIIMFCNWVLSSFLSNYLLFMYTLITILATLILAYCLDFLYRMVDMSKSVIKAEKMEVVSQLAASISHEVRNPLTVVKGFLQLLERQELGTDARDYIKLSLSEIERANDIIVGYLTFAKPAPEHIEVLDVRAEIKQALTVIQPLANLHNTRIVTDLDSFKIEGVSQLLQQCLMNLFKNCIEAMPNRGTLLVKAKRFGTDRCFIQIVDTGTGMTKEQISRVGEPYFTTKGRNGTGLGMMAVLRIIELLQGEFKIESEPFKGTTFIMSFDVAGEG